MTPSAATTVSFLRLAIVFVAGGLFFSSAVAAATASYALGADNIKRFQEMARIVWEGVWLTFTMGLSSTKEVLVSGHYNGASLWKRYKQAWRTLWCKMGETRRKAVEGVQAIQREVKMCAAAVGPPGLIPLQYALERQLHFTIGHGIEEALRGAVEGVELSNIDLTLSRFHVGDVAPSLEAARVYDLGEDAMAFDFDIKWKSELKATIQAHSSYLPPKLPVTLHHVHFRGPVRVVMTPLTNSYPGFGATLVSFPAMPEIGFDIRVAGGDVTQVLPMLRAELLGAMERGIEESMIWPKRVVVPSYPVDDPTTPILSEKELKELKTTDPMLQAEEALGSRPLLRRKLNQMTDLLYQDSDELKSIVDLPMPSFQTDKTEEKKEPVTTKPSQPKVVHVMPATAEPNVVWGQLQRAHQLVVDRHHQTLEKTEKFLKQHPLWIEMEKLQEQTKEHMKKFQSSTLVS